MSKPKPGLGKGIVRTFVSHSHGHHHQSIGNASLQLVPAHGHAHGHGHGHGHYSYGSYSVQTTTSASSSGGSSGGTGSSARRDGFASLGLPTSKLDGSPSIPFSSSTTTTNPSTPWSLASATHLLEDIKSDIVLPFRPSRYHHTASSATAMASHTSTTLSSTSQSTPTTTTHPSSAHVRPRSRGKRGLSTFSPNTPSSLYNSPLTDIPPSLFSSLPPTNIATNWYGGDRTNSSLNLSFTSNSHANPYAKIYDVPPLSSGGGGNNSTSFEIDFYPTPSPSPTPARIRPNEIHPALSPIPHSTSSETPIGPISFTSLGIPSSSHPFDPLSSGTSTEGTALNLYSSNLIFHLGASGSAKDRPAFVPTSSKSPTPPPRPRSFPLPEVTAPLAGEYRSVGVGEDAYFARMDGMCIADGVGGWARSGRGGADAGRWSRLLTHFCEIEVGDWWAGKAPYLRDDGGGGGSGGGGWAKKAWKDGKGKGRNSHLEARGSSGGASESFATDTAADGEEGKRRPLDPVEIMQRGYEKCLSCFTAEGIHGSSTCLLALLHHSTLSIANLGDCALLLIRDNQVIFRTDEMQHAFNFPLQLGTHSRDEPMKDAKRYDVGVVKGDVVVLGSDGLMDNLFDEDVLDILEQFSPPDVSPSASSSIPTPPFSRPGSTGGLPYFSPQKVSEELCRRARAVSEQTTATTPFMVKAIEEGIDFVGGKKDDISVVVGVIGDREAGHSLGGLALHT